VGAATISTVRGIRSARFLAASTGLRIVLTPVVMGLLMIDGTTPGSISTAAAVLVAVAAATDWIDGRLARRWGVTSKLGSFLDTTADKLLVSGVLIVLVSAGRASPWAAAIIIGRELLIMGLRGLVASEGTVMPPSIWGKLKANVQFAAILLAILRPDIAVGPLLLDEWAMALASFVTVMSAVEYLARYSSALLRPPR
jgi:CDP-diacylglycerol--glycerol-3-phosphate 3-phosphatidyltransferase